MSTIPDIQRAFVRALNPRSNAGGDISGTEFERIVAAAKSDDGKVSVREWQEINLTVADLTFFDGETQLVDGAYELYIETARSVHGDGPVPE
jgi:hypothetical protein